MLLPDMGRITQNRERNLRLEIIERYENAGRQVDAKGNVVTEGKNWLEGLTGHVKDNMALLYENQAKTILETTDTQSSGSFQTIAFPMVRRIFSKLLANDIVSVQAMTHPSGDLFFFYPLVSDRIVSQDEQGNEIQGHPSPHARSLAECAIGSNCPDATFENCKSLYDRFYNDAEGIYDHSKGKFTIITATGTQYAFDSNSCWTTANTVKLATDGTIRTLIYGINGFDGSNAGTSNGHNARLRGGRGLEIDTYEFLASFSVIYAGATPITDGVGNIIYNQGDLVEYRLVKNRYGKTHVEYADLCDANGTLYVELDFTHPIADCTTCGSPDGYLGANSGTTFTVTDFAFAWRKYDDLEYESEMGEVSFTIKKITISVTSRKLRARWSPELATDVNAYHNIDAEAELTALLSEQIAMEIDREILRTLKNGAAWTLRWNFNGWKNQGSQKYTAKEWKQTLITAINQVSAQIHKSTLRGGANFIVISTEASAIFDDLENFMVSNNNIDDDKYNLGMRRLGTLSGRYTVYVDPYSRAGDVLVGHKGDSILDTGFIYAPYVPLQLTPALQDPNNFTNVKGIMTRYAMSMVNNAYYGMVKIDNIPTFDTRELR